MVGSAQGVPLDALAVVEDPRRSWDNDPEDSLSATLQSEADPTLEIEATGSCCLVCRVLGLDAGQGVDPAVA